MMYNIVNIDEIVALVNDIQNESITKTQLPNDDISSSEMLSDVDDEDDWDDDFEDDDEYDWEAVLEKEGINKAAI